MFEDAMSRVLILVKEHDLTSLLVVAIGFKTQTGGKLIWCRLFLLLDAQAIRFHICFKLPDIFGIHIF